MGVAENADDATIKKAYRKLAKDLHPDVTGNDKKKTERFKEINDAYSVLGDAQKRKEYDRLKHAPVRPDGMPEGFDADAFAQTFGRARTSAGGVEINGDFDMNDIFASLFGGGGRGPGGGFNPRGRTRARPNRGPDAVGRLEITLAEAALGAKRSVRNGAGNTVEVNIPPGVETGGKLRLPGQGAPLLATTARPATCTWRSRSGPTAFCGETAPISSWTCRSRLQRPRWAPRSRFLRSKERSP